MVFLYNVWKLQITYKTKIKNRINDDELPPDYEDIIKGEDQNAAPKDGDGCAAG